MRTTKIAEDIAEIVCNLDLYPMQNSRVLVTGTSGILGQYITYVLLAIPGIDLHIHAHKSPPADLQINKVAGVYIGNLANQKVVNKLPEADWVICAHSYAQPLRFLAEPLTALRGSSYGLLGLLEKCAVGGRFLYLSSSEIYCDSPSPPPHTEDHIGMITPYHPRACYIMGKMFGESITYLYRQRGISTVSVRPGITYGPGFKRDDQRSWASFIQRAVDTKKIDLLDGGSARRTFCYIRDGIEMLFRIWLEGRQEAYNLAGEDTVSINEIAQYIANAAGAKVTVPDTDDKGVAGTPENLAMSMDRYNAEFGKHKYLDLAQGIERTVEWYREQYT